MLINCQKLKYLRVVNKISQTELAKMMGVTRNYISRLENGNQCYSQKKCDEWLNAINYIVMLRMEKTKNEYNE